MTGDVQLPAAIDPDAPYAEFRATQCKECGEAGPITLVTNAEWRAWFARHSDATGHTRLFEYKITRSVGQETHMPMRKRRSLGTR